MVELKGYRVNELNIKNAGAPNANLKLKNRVKYNVTYLKKICLGVAELTVAGPDSGGFEIRLKLTAEFRFDPAARKTDLHKKSFDLIFPVIRVMVSTVTAAMGLPGLVLPPMRLDRGVIISTAPPPGSGEEQA